MLIQALTFPCTFTFCYSHREQIIDHRCGSGHKCWGVRPWEASLYFSKQELENENLTSSNIRWDISEAHATLFLRGPHQDRVPVARRCKASIISFPVLPHFSTLLPMFPGIPSPIGYWLPIPCFRVYVWVSIGERWYLPRRTPNG